MSDNKLFRGYIITKNKKSTMKFKKGDPLLTYDGVAHLDEYAGVLADDVVLIDVDDSRQADIMLKFIQEHQFKCRAVRSTRGLHVYFKNSKITKCATATTIVSGFTCDIKGGFTNSYAVLKKDGVEREVVYDAGEYEDIPFYFYDTFTKKNFDKLGEGDGRNAALFAYIPTLQKLKIDKEQIKQIISYINFNILPKPLEQSELDVILRDDSFKSTVSDTDTYFSNKVFLFDKFARHLCERYNIIKISNQLHIYENGIYKNDSQYIEQKMIDIIPKLSKSQRTEVLNYIQILIKENSQPSDPRYIAFKNGVYDLIEDKLLDFDTSFILTNRINFNYNTAAYSDLCDNTLNQYSCNNGATRMLLEEVIGYCFYRRNELRKAFILIGNKANGKSTYLAMIRHLLGDENISSLDLKEIGDRFRTAAIFGKLANIGDDISADYLPDLSTFRKVVSGDRITAERKGIDPFDFDSFAKFLFSANELPRMKDSTGSNINRFIIVPFNASFTPNSPSFDPFIKYKLLKNDVMEYLIQLGIRGLKRVLYNNKFTITHAVEEELAEYEKMNNPIISFFEDFTEFENNTIEYCFDKYMSFCLKDNLTPMAKQTFSKSVRKEFNLDTKVVKIDGKAQRIFVKK